MVDPLRFDGRAVVVTGAGRGLGKAYACHLAARGAMVVVNDLGTDLEGAGAGAQPADDVVAEITASGGTAVADHHSIATAEGATAVVEAALERFGRLDAVVNNAGIMRMRPFEEVTVEGLQAHLDVHVIGTFRVCKAAWPAMTAAGYGRIVNTVSGGIFGLPGLTEYGPAKGAVFALTRSLALEGAEHGIGVNAIAPQGATRMLRASGLDPDVRARMEEMLPPALAAPGVAFLAHERCTLQGETLAVSGGKVCRIGLSENEGITVADLQPEDIAARIDEVVSTDTAQHWRSSVEK